MAQVDDMNIFVVLDALIDLVRSKFAHAKRFDEFSAVIDFQRKIAKNDSGKQSARDKTKVSRCTDDKLNFCMKEEAE